MEMNGQNKRKGGGGAAGGHAVQQVDGCIDEYVKEFFILFYFFLASRQSVNDPTGTKCLYLSVQGLFLQQEEEAACCPSSCQ